MLKSVVVVAVIALVLAAFARAGDLAPRRVCPVGSPSEMLCLHDYARRMHGLRPLRWYGPLATAAARKANRIAATGEFSHTPGGMRWDAYFPRVNGKAENLAWGYPSKRATFAAWLASPGHRENILLPWLRWYGSDYRSDRRLWAVDFGG